MNRLTLLQQLALSRYGRSRGEAWGWIIKQYWESDYFKDDEDYDIIALQGRVVIHVHDGEFITIIAVCKDGSLDGIDKYSLDEYY